MLKLSILIISVLALGASNRAVAQSPQVIRDVAFLQDVHEPHPLPSAAENDVRAIAIDPRGRVWVATAAGIRFLDGSRWHTPSGGDIGPVHSLRVDKAGRVWAGAWNGVYRASQRSVDLAGLAGEPIGAIAGSGESLYAGGPHGIWKKIGNSWTRVKGSWHTAIRALLPDPAGKLWIATASGLYIQATESVRMSRPDVILSSNVYALKKDEHGRIWAGSTGGIDVYELGKRKRAFTGLPSRHARAFAFDKDNRVWVASKLGVERFDGKRWSLRHSRRWLLSDDVRDVAIGADGTAWAATASGVSAIRRIRITLADKADRFLKILRARHIRPPGLIGPAVLERQGDLSKSFIEDDDNDGEHTGMYLAIESFRYAVTKAPDARENAKAAFHALEQLQRVTGTNHFIARSMLPAGVAPLHEVDHKFTPQEIAETNRTDPREKIIEKRWVPSRDGKWLWKRDASSDEVDGHMFGYNAYFDLCADPEEKKRVAAQVDRIVGGIVDHGFTLQDIDGKATRWGNWSPASLNGDPNWHEERPGNSLEILAFLGIAHHMTGNPRYVEAARKLIATHGYAHNAGQTIFDTPSERTHIEDELLSIVYPGAVTHALTPALRSSFKLSMQRWYRTCQRDRVAVYDFVYNRFSGRRSPLDGAAETLRDWPLDWIEWTVDNRAREDVEWDRTPGLEEDRLKTLLPRSEMGICNCDQEPYKPVIGLDGRREDKPLDWLMAYWMGRYYGLISAPNTAQSFMVKRHSRSH